MPLAVTAAREAGPGRLDQGDKGPCLGRIWLIYRLAPSPGFPLEDACMRLTAYAVEGSPPPTSGSLPEAGTPVTRW